MVQSAQQAVSTAAVVAQGTPAAGTGSVPGSHVVLRPANGNIYVGGSDVSSSNGFLVASGGILGVDLETGESLYAVAASGTVTVHILKSGV